MGRYLLVLFIFFHAILCSQNVSSLGNDGEEIEKLIHEIRNAKDDSIKGIKHIKLSGFYFKNNAIENYQFHLGKAKEYSQGRPFLEAYAAYYGALIHLSKNEYETFMVEISNVLEKLKLHDNPTSNELQLIIIQNISTYYSSAFKFVQSMELLMNDGIPLAEKMNNHLILGSFNQIIASSFYSLDEADKAKYYFEKSILNYKKDSEKGLGLLNACSIDYANCLIELHDFDQAQEILDEVHKTLTDNTNNNLFPRYYQAYGHLYQERGDYDKAIDHYQLGLQKMESNDLYDKNGKLYSLLKLGLSKAKLGINDHLGSLQELDGLNYIDLDISLLQNELRYKNFKQLGNPTKAFEHFQKYVVSRDSLKDMADEREYRMLESKYDASEKEKKIIALEKETKEKEIRLKNLRLWYGFISITLITTLVLFYFLQKNYKNQRRINRQNDIIYKQNLDQINAQKEIEIMQAMIDGEEAERKRIARDLHDGIGSRLSSLKMQINQLEPKNGMFPALDTISEGLSMSITDLRRTAVNLVPETLSKLGLELALKDLCFSMGNAKVNILFSSNEIQDDLIESNQITIFRIVQELINNALKHANCTEIIVDCSQNENLFLITIEDDGIGFNTGDLVCFPGLGLKNIKNRVELLKGRMDISSSSCNGTAFNIELTVQSSHERKV